VVVEDMKLELEEEGVDGVNMEVVEEEAEAEVVVLESVVLRWRWRWR
jgi:hypothetical protein